MVEGIGEQLNSGSSILVVVGTAGLLLAVIAYVFEDMVAEVMFEEGMAVLKNQTIARLERAQLVMFLEK